MLTRREWLWGALAAVPSGCAATAPTGDRIDSYALHTARVGPRAWVLVELRTAQGLTGLGDATANETVPTGGDAAAREMFAVIRGRSPFEVERLRGAALKKVASAESRARRQAVAICSGIEAVAANMPSESTGSCSLTA